MWLKLSLGAPSICVRSFQSMKGCSHMGRCFKIQRKQWLQCFTNGIEIRSLGRLGTWMEWSANDTPTCTTHATTLFPRHAKLLCLTLLNKGSASLFLRPLWCNYANETIVTTSVGWYWIFIKTFGFKFLWNISESMNEPWVPFLFYFKEETSVFIKERVKNEWLYRLLLAFFHKKNDSLLCK
jgi:hypothetical protein